MFSKKEEELRKKRPWRPWKPKVAPRVTLIDLPTEVNNVFSVFTYLSLLFNYENDVTIILGHISTIHFSINN